MNKLPLMKIAFLLYSSMLIVSCSKSDTTNNNNNNSDNLAPIITAGTWRISSFTQRSEDNTSKFAGYTFTFTQDGKLNAIANGKTTAGTWSWGGTSYYGVNVNKNLYILNLGSDEPLRRLSHDWVVNNKSQSSVQFSSSEPAENEIVTFSKQ